MCVYIYICLDFGDAKCDLFALNSQKYASIENPAKANISDMNTSKIQGR